MTNTMYSKEKTTPIQIFTRDDGSNEINVVKSPVKLTILSMLLVNEMDFDDIVKNTGKSKSTVSVHLKSLKEDGLVSSKVNPEDNRKKIFYVNSRKLGEVTSSNYSDLEEIQTKFLVENILEEKDFRFSFLLFHTFRSKLIQEGMNIDPLLLDTGRQLGSAIYEEIKDDDRETFLKNMQTFWENSGLGKLTIDFGDIIEITNTDCFECELLPKVGKPVCFIDVGIIESLMSKHLQKEVDVTEVKCYTMGDDCCKFIVEFAESN